VWVLRTPETAFDQHAKALAKSPAGTQQEELPMVFDIAPLRRLMNYRAFPDQSLIGSCALADLESKM